MTDEKFKAFGKTILERPKNMDEVLYPNATNTEIQKTVFTENRKAVNPEKKPDFEKMTCHIDKDIFDRMSKFICESKLKNSKISKRYNLRKIVEESVDNFLSIKGF